MAYQMQMPYGVAYVMAPGGAAVPVAALPTGIVAVPTYAPGFVPANPAAYAAFQAVDTDKSGSIEWKELGAALGSSFIDPNFPGA